MICSRTTLASLIALSLCAGFAHAEEGWINMFNGKTLEGWTQKNGTATYRGEDGVIVWDYISQLVWVYGKDDRRAEDYEESINAERNLMYVEELRHLVDCVEGRATPELDAAGGRTVLGIALAAKRSAVEGRPVKLIP